MAKLAKYQIRALKQLRREVSFETASFGNIVGIADQPLPKSEAEVDAFIKERTRLYIESWVLPLIDALIDQSEHGRNAVQMLIRR